jgi:carboxymethylenebutenolidase
MPIITETIAYQSGVEQLAGFLARPEGAGPFPGVVVIHEAFGLNENIRGIARRFADTGYAALAVDLFANRNRVACMFRFFSGIFFNSLEHGGIHDLKAALTFLAGQPFVDDTRVGAVGYCMGGSFAMAWACTDDRLKVIAPYYGMNPRPLEAVARLCPVVGSYPEADFTAPHGRKLDAMLEDHHIPHDIKIYPGARHSFFNEQRANYNADAAQDSWQRVQAYFKAHLG